MKRFTTVEAADAFLLRYSPEKQSGETYKLDRMRQLMERLGNPQNDIPAIHVAGTSGKTSTAYFIRSLLQAHGVRTGLTTSPHISSVTERVQVDGGPLPDDTFLTYLDEFLTIIERWADIRPTYFELLTAFAFWTFKRQNLDYMVIEVGLGGLLDATNVIDGPRKISVITPIGLDHTEVLGPTVADIAAQKLGIVNQDSVVFSTQQAGEVREVVQAVAKERRARAIDVRPVRDEHVPVPLFQQDNFSVVIAVVRYVAERDTLSHVDDGVLARLVTATPPGRFEIYDIAGKTVVLDGAHNPQKLSAFAESLRHRYDGPYAWLIGFIAAPDEKINDCIDVIADRSDRYIATQFSVGQDIKGRGSIAAAALCRKLTDKGCEAMLEPDADAAFDVLLQSKQRTVVVTGSLYLVARLRERARALATT